MSIMLYIMTFIGGIFIGAMLILVPEVLDEPRPADLHKKPMR
jgi:hypothetical protein